MKAMPTEKDISTAASLLGRIGGLRSAEGRMRNLTFERRSALGKAAIAKRWEKYRRGHEKAEAQARAAGAGNPSGEPAPRGNPGHKAGSRPRPTNSQGSSPNRRRKGAPK